MNHTNAELPDIHFIYCLANINGLLLLSCMRKDIQRGGNRILKNVPPDVSEPGGKWILQNHG